MSAQILVFCPRCAQQMLVNSANINTRTGCIFCPADFVPAQSVVAPPPLPKSGQSAAARGPSFDFDEPEPRRRERISDNRVRYREERSFASSFGRAFGSTLGNSLASLLIVLIVVAIAGAGLAIWFASKQP